METMRKGIISILAAGLVLVACVTPRPCAAQFIGYVGQQTVLQTPTQLGMNAVSGPTISNTIPNIGQGAHYLTYCINGGTATTVGIQIEGSVNGSAFFAISNQGISTSGCSTIATGGYFPVVRVNLVTFVPNGTTLSATYSATSGTLPFTGGIVSSQVTGTNVGQFGGQPMQTGTGSSGAGVPRVTVSNDSTIPTTQSGTWNVRATGNAGAAFDAPSNSAPPANVLSQGQLAQATSANPSAATNGNMVQQTGDITGNTFVRVGGPNPITCYARGVGTSLADFTQINGSTGCGSTPGAGLRVYITDVVVSSTTATAASFRLSFGTGAACVTTNNALFPGNTGDLWFAPGNTALPAVYNFTQPLVSTAANRLCVIGSSGTNTVNVSVNGFIAP